MNILHTETLKKWGGQQNRVLTEAAGLVKRGHTAVIACHTGSMLAQRAREAGIPVYEVNMAKKAHLSTIPKLVQIIKKHNVDIVSTHSSVDSWAGGIAARISRSTLVRFKHNLNDVANDPLTRFIYSLPDLFIAVNATAAEVLKRSAVIRAGMVVHVYGSVDCARFNPVRFMLNERLQTKESLGIPAEACVVGNTSGFTDVKGQKYLLAAANRLFRQRNDLYLLLLGRLGHKEKVLSLIEPAFHNRVVLPGLRDDVPSMLALMDIFVFPSVREAFGNSLIEAMAMARPVAVSDLPSFREFMTEGVDGLFFRKADPDHLYGTVMDLLDNKARWHALGAAARRTVIDRFQYGRMIEETEHAYLSLLGDRGR